MSLANEKKPNGFDDISLKIGNCSIIKECKTNVAIICSFLQYSEQMALFYACPTIYISPGTFGRESVLSMVKKQLKRLTIDPDWLFNKPLFDYTVFTASFLLFCITNDDFYRPDDDIGCVEEEEEANFGLVMDQLLVTPAHFISFYERFKNDQTDDDMFPITEYLLSRVEKGASYCESRTNKNGLICLHLTINYEAVKLIAPFVNKLTTYPFEYTDIQSYVRTMFDDTPVFKRQWSIEEKIVFAYAQEQPLNPNFCSLKFNGTKLFVSDWDVIWKRSQSAVLVAEYTYARYSWLIDDDARFANYHKQKSRTCAVVFSRP